MDRLLLLGDEAIGQAAIDAGISGIYAYPGTPSTEITEYVQNNLEAAAKNIRSQWSANEKTAMEAALGMSYAGKRTMVCMKHVGLNVAADAFINAGITGVNGGLVVTVADDPGMHSSQNEQDSRFYGKFAMVPVLEPSSQQEAYEMVHEGFDLSEKTGLPVVLRVTTRLAHSRAAITRRETREQNGLQLPNDPKQFILLPAIARQRYKVLLQAQEQLEKVSETSTYNQYQDGPHHKIGIVACGIAYNYLMEHYPGTCPYPVLKIAQYPMPAGLIRRIAEACDEVLVLEDGYPLVEEAMKGILGNGSRIKGKLDGSLPRDGELTPDLVAGALKLNNLSGQEIPGVVVPRPPAMCKGCSHVDTYNALLEALGGESAGKVFSDIGCYTLGALPPFQAINTCVDMGASVTMAKGAADAGLSPAIAVIGDSTFTHSGMTGLLDAVNENSPVTIIISDNDTTGMTGGQPSSGTGKLEAICLGIGVALEHVRVLNPLKKHHAENVRVMKEEIAYPGTSVIISRRECIQTAKRRKKQRNEN
jgi:indolepyruvate ferredoxin oxidoreductase alpha subunit